MTTKPPPDQYSHSSRKAWIALAVVVFGSFAILLALGRDVYQEAPPVPDKVVDTHGEVVMPSGQIQLGQSVWQAIGGMEVGSIWGHGAYVAPDWTADYLHREIELVLDTYAQESHGTDYASLDEELQAGLRQRAERSFRTNTYDAETNSVTISPERADAYEQLVAYYTDVFTNGRADMAIPAGAQADPAKVRQLTSFFFWSAWAASTDRLATPGISYTNNWPHEPLISNTVTGDAVIWTGVSIIVLLAGLTAMVWWRASLPPLETAVKPAKDDPLLDARMTPSQKVTMFYFGVVTALILVQIILGVVTAHFGVEGDGFYGIPLSEFLPYVITRTWHQQLGIYWIATAWLAAGLFVAPAVGYEPKGQVWGVSFLLFALVVVVVGSMAGQWMSVMHKFSDDNVRWMFGHTGYEYLDLGRFFQYLLIIGLFLWCFLMFRAMWPALMRKDENRGLLLLFALSTLAIAGFYLAALGAGHTTNLAIANYWRWWVVHLWVEGFFEVFATVVFAFLFAKLGLLEPKTTEKAVVLSATIFLAGGIIGTLHHLYFSGTPSSILAFGSVFSALEVVPLVFIGYEAFENYRLSKSAPWVQRYKWPIMFFIAMAFWNAIGAGLFGFMINPPVALYFMQGLNTTPVHAHAALFGVYGMLGIALMLFCIRAAAPRKEWNERPIKWTFWLLNVGLFLMVTVSLLPVGLMQTYAAVDVGYWYARSPEFLQTPVMHYLRWSRAIGDTIFGLGAVTFTWFALTLLKKDKATEAPVKAESAS